LGKQARGSNHEFANHFSKDSLQLILLGPQDNFFAMASSLKARFEQLAADQLKDPSMEEKEVVVEQEIEDPKLGWKHSGNSGGTNVPPSASRFLQPAYFSCRWPHSP